MNDDSKTRQDGLESGSRKGVVAKVSTRLVSLDAFRGLAILGMLLVNNTVETAATPRHLKHAAWNQGVHFADLVFPWFLYIVGVAIPYAAASARKRGLSQLQYRLKAASRALMLVLLGCLIDSSVRRTPTLGLGVLQLIGLAYFAGTLLYPLKPGWRLGIAAELLVGYWVLIRFVPIPGIGPGSLTETHNLVKHINDTYLAAYGLSGLLSVIPTTALVLIGAATGDLLRLDRLGQRQKVIYLSLGGVVLTLLGLLWNVDLPFNKPMWTSSYILYTAGLGAIVLSVFYYVLDIKLWRAWAFGLVVCGVNAIVAYVAPILLKTLILQSWHWNYHGSTMSLQDAYVKALSGQFGVIWGSWIYTFSYMLFWWVILLWLYRRKLFLRV